MSEPKHDKTLHDEIDEGIAKNVRLGFMIEVEPGQFKLTPKGIAYVEAMLPDLSSRDTNNVG